MSTSNAAELTRARGALAAKKRARRGEVREVVFDEDARREYLTGFRKRNVLKKEARAKTARERARAERLAVRREHRRELAERAAQNAREVEGALGGGAAAATAAATPAAESAHEYGGDEELAVVTIVEAFSVERK